MNIKENDFRYVDLNLLIVFMVLFREESVSLAADKLNLGQPAISASLSRLRDMFQDPLFIRSGRKMLPTARSVQLQKELIPVMEQLQVALFNPKIFNPKDAKLTITIGMTDWVEIWLLPKVIKKLKNVAPGITLNIVESTPFTDQKKLASGDIDLAISVASSPEKNIEREVLETMNFVALWHPSQLHLSDPLSIEDYAKQQHIMVTYREAISSKIDVLLMEAGSSRNVCYTTPHFSVIPSILKSTPMIATVPEGLTFDWMDSWGLNKSVLPVNHPSFDIKILWHKRNTENSALQWLREFIQSTCR